MLKYLLFIILGILIFILLNRKDGFSIGARIIRHEHTQFGDYYYYNTVTGKSTWEIPYGRDTVQEGAPDINLPEGPPPGPSLGPPGHLDGEFSIKKQEHSGIGSGTVGAGGDVWRGTYNGDNIVIKTMNAIELQTLQVLNEFPGVVRLIGIAPYSLYTDDESRPELLQKMLYYKIKLVVMEELKPIIDQFSKDRVGVVPFINTGEGNVALQNSFLSGQDIEIELKCSPVNKKLFGQLLTTIININSIGYLWGDLKPQNMGIDKSGNLKIYDFGFSRTPEYWSTKLTSTIRGHVIAVEQHKPYIWSDLLAFGKLYLNELVWSFVFIIGYDYIDNVFTLSYQDYQNILSKLTGPKDLVDESIHILKLCFSLNINSTKDDIKLIQEGFLKLFS